MVLEIVVIGVHRWHWPTGWHWRCPALRHWSKGPFGRVLRVVRFTKVCMIIAIQRWHGRRWRRSAHATGLIQHGRIGAVAGEACFGSGGHARALVQCRQGGLLDQASTSGVHGVGSVGRCAGSRVRRKRCSRVRSVGPLHGKDS